METFPRPAVLSPPLMPELAADVNSAAWLSDGFRALADPTRLQLLHLLLTRGELCVCELLGVMELTPSNLTFHLNTLRQAGFIRPRKQGRWVFYDVDRERLSAFQREFTWRFDPDQIPLTFGRPAYRCDETEDFESGGVDAPCD